MSQLKRMQAMLEGPGSVQVTAVRDHAAPDTSTPAPRLERLAEPAARSEQVAFTQSQSPAADELQPLVVLEAAQEQGALGNGGGASDSQDPFRRGRARPTQ